MMRKQINSWLQKMMWHSIVAYKSLSSSTSLPFIFLSSFSSDGNVSKSKYIMWYGKTYVISNSGPVRYVAPFSRASMIDCNIREWFPSKSKAHWLSVETATVTFRPIFVVVARQYQMKIRSAAITQNWKNESLSWKCENKKINFISIQFYLWNFQWRLFRVYRKLDITKLCCSKNWMADRPFTIQINSINEIENLIELFCAQLECLIEFLAVAKDYRLNKETVAISMHSRHRIYTI